MHKYIEKVKNLIFSLSDLTHHICISCTLNSKKVGF